MKAIKKIVVPIDFSSHTDQVLDTVKTMAKIHESEVVLYYVVKSLANYAGFSIPHISFDVLEKELGAEANKKMNSIVEKLEKQLPAVRGLVVTGDEVAEKIVTFANREKADLIVMSTFGLKGIEKTILGSVAEEVIRTATCTVLIVKP